MYFFSNTIHSCDAQSNLGVSMASQNQNQNQENLRAENMLFLPAMIGGQSQIAKQYHLSSILQVIELLNIICRCMYSKSTNIIWTSGALAD